MRGTKRSSVTGRWNSKRRRYDTIPGTLHAGHDYAQVSIDSLDHPRQRPLSDRPARDLPMNDQLFTIAQSVVLGVVSILVFLYGRTEKQSADAVRTRIDSLERTIIARLDGIERAMRDTDQA